MSALSYVKRPRHAVDDVLMADIRSRLTHPRTALSNRAAGIYRAGKAPQWAAAADAAEEDGQGEEDDRGRKEVEKGEEQEAARRDRRAEQSVDAQPTAAFAPLGAAHSAPSSTSRESGSGVAVSPPSSAPLDDSSAMEAAAERRRRAMARRMAGHGVAGVEVEPPPQRPSEADEAQTAMEGEEGEESDSEEESEASSASPSSPPPRSLFAPVFRRAALRSTLNEEDVDGGEGQGPGVEEEGDRERRRELSHDAVQQSMRREEEREARKAAAGPDGEAMVDDADKAEGTEEAEREFDLWKLREIHRIQRDRAVAERAKTAEEGAGQRVTGEADEEATGEAVSVPSAGPSHYLQRYYHKGAFFADERAAEPAVFSRDFQTATGEDRMVGDRRLLPKVLQVKRFGLKGRTKYTHLTDQDTSRMNREDGDRGRPLPVREVGSRGFKGIGVGNG